MIGKFSSKETARAALFSAFLKSPGWWNLDAIHDWARRRGISKEEARGLVTELFMQGFVKSRLVSGRVNWRVQR